MIAGLFCLIGLLGYGADGPHGALVALLIWGVAYIMGRELQA